MRLRRNLSSGSGNHKLALEDSDLRQLRTQSHNEEKEGRFTSSSVGTRRFQVNSGKSSVSSDDVLFGCSVLFYDKYGVYYGKI